MNDLTRICEFCGSSLKLVKKIKAGRGRLIQRHKCTGCSMEYSYTTTLEEDEENDRKIFEKLRREKDTLEQIKRNLL